jgi:acyl carrier protein
MNRAFTIAIALVCALLTASSAFAQDRTAIVERVRAELATVLKKDATKLPVDKPVAELGADELSVVEWQMASEKAFRVHIDDDRLFDPKSKAIQKSLSISSMAQIVATSRPWPKGKTR